MNTSHVLRDSWDCDVDCAESIHNYTDVKLPNGVAECSSQFALHGNFIHGFYPQRITQSS